MLQINSKYYVGYCPPSSKSNVNKVMQEKGYEYNGEISPKTKAKIQRMWDNYTASNHHESLMMYTLTLPNEVAKNVSDKDAKRHILGDFLKRMQEADRSITYFWRAETQGNGNIHFHVLTNMLPMWYVIDKNRNIQQRNKQYNIIKQWFDEQTKDSEILKKQYIITNDIHNCWAGSIAKYKMRLEGKSIKKFIHMEEYNSEKVKLMMLPILNTKYIKEKDRTFKYCMKYATKEEGQGRRKVEGRVWGCSDNLRLYRGITIDESSNYIVRDEIMKDVEEVIQLDEIVILKTDEGVSDLWYIAFFMVKYAVMASNHDHEEKGSTDILHKELYRIMSNNKSFLNRNSRDNYVHDILKLAAWYYGYKKDIFQLLNSVYISGVVE